MYDILGLATVIVTVAALVFFFLDTRLETRVTRLGTTIGIIAAGVLAWATYIAYYVI
jgi:hypothetical protein